MKPTAFIFPLIIGLAIGVLLTAQFKAARNRILNPVEPFTSLTEARDSLTEKVAKLKDEVKVLRDDTNTLQDKLKRSKRTNQELVDQSESLKALVGLKPAQDSGVVITLADAPQGELSVDSIIHAADLRDLANVLWAAGASAVSINDERLVATTSVDSIINTVLVNNARITSPFTVKATGDSRKLADAVKSQSNLGDLNKRSRVNGIIFNVTKTREVNIAAFTGSFNINFARLAP